MAADATQVMGWYVTHDNGEMDGPLSDADMRSAITRGRVKPEARVWRDGMDEWVEARRIPNYEDLRRTHLDAIARQASAREVRHAGQAEKRAQAKTPRAPSIERSSQGWRNAQRSPPSAPPPASAPSKGPSGGWSHDDAAPGAGGQQIGLPDLEKMAKDALGQFNGIPTGVIVFVVLGLVFTPLLPIFWFIAWRMWTTRKK